MPVEPRFNVFSDENESGVLWLECVEGFASARERMEQTASRMPGKYFVFSYHSHRILAQLDTTKNLLR
jgi:hypothetical protein